MIFSNAFNPLSIALYAKISMHFLFLHQWKVLVYIRCYPLYGDLSQILPDILGITKAALNKLECLKCSNKSTKIKYACLRKYPTKYISLLFNQHFCYSWCQQQRLESSPWPYVDDARVLPLCCSHWVTLLYLFWITDFALKTLWQYL